MTPAFDHDELMDRLDGDLEFLEETMEILDEDTPPLVAQIREAAAARDADALVAPAHTLKGMVSNFCAEAAERTARDLETRGREQRLDGVDAVVETLDQEITRLRAELQTFLRSQRS